MRRALALVVVLAHVAGFRIARPWTEKHWCESVREPEWPFAYSKYAGQVMERKGRTNIDQQDTRHACATKGVESKCHVCEPIACGEDGSATCNYQTQGVSWHGLSVNVPTASDSPWAIAGGHRYDFGNESTRGVCVMVSGGHCVSPYGADYSNCTVRCWGYTEPGAKTKLSATERSHLEANRSYVRGEDNTDAYRRADGDSALATDVWEYPEQYSFEYSFGDEPVLYNPQGRVFTLAGGGRPGYADGREGGALFSRPQDVAVDRDRNVYVADAGNHVIRCVKPNGRVLTIAGVPGEAGYRDGDGDQALFSSPSGVAVYYGKRLNLFVADTDNHRVRRIVLHNGTDGKSARVSCFAGRCGNGTISYTATQSRAPPQAGLADGWPSVARFDTPQGIDVASDGTVYVADTNNHLVRAINQTGFVITLAGNVEVAEANGDGEPLEGCPPPCLKGVSGYRDGNVTFARFYYPSDVAAVPHTNGTVLVTDQHRLRRVTPANVRSTIQGVTTAGGRVVTIAGARARARAWRNLSCALRPLLCEATSRARAAPSLAKPCARLARPTRRGRARRARRRGRIQSPRRCRSVR